MSGWRRKLTSLALMGLTLAAMTVTAMAEPAEGIHLQGKTAAPFVVSYRENGEIGADLGELWQLTAGNAAWNVYRTEPGSVPEEGSYRRVNLEESTSRAGKLRAVVLEGYPSRDTEALEKRANAWLRSVDGNAIVDLQAGEALLATQTAIWELTGENFSVETYLSHRKNLTTALWEGYRAQSNDPGMLTQQETDYSQKNVQSLCAYFRSLSPVEPQRETVSDASIKGGQYTATPAADGSCTITARVEVTVEDRGEQELVLTAVCGQERKEQAVLQSGQYEFSFPGQPERQNVTISLSGFQRGRDVYFYESGNTRLVGVDRELLPVSGETVLHPDRILRIFKNTPGEEGQPLANIQFNLYRAEEGGSTSNGQPTQEELARYQTAENLVAIISTDENGIAEYNFTAAGQEDGVYLVVEQFCAGTTGPVSPFYLELSGIQGDLEIFLENTAETQPEIWLNVGEIGLSQASFPVMEPHSWFIQASLPAGLSSARAYTLTLPEAEWLQWNGAELAVTVETQGGDSLHLAQNVHYIRQMGPQIGISLTPAGMAYAAANGKEEGRLQIRLSGTIGQNAPLGVQLRCRAMVEYTNAAGIRYSKTSEPAQVHTGGLAIQKTDSGGTPLAGAAFSLARDAEAGEENGEFLQIGDTRHRVVYVSFYPDRDKTGEPVTQTLTNAEGRAWFCGLAYGTYYLVETQDANGMATEPQVVTVDALSHLDGSDGEGDHTLLLTGGWYLLSYLRNAAIPLLTAVGIAASLCACGLLVGGKSREYV